jgi:hypothetical protein
MAISIPNQYPVCLSVEQRQRFEDIARNGRAPAKKISHARVLLLSDRNREEGPMTRGQIDSCLRWKRFSICIRRSTARKSR